MLLLGSYAKVFYEMLPSPFEANCRVRIKPQKLVPFFENVLNKIQSSEEWKVNQKEKWIRQSNSCVFLKIDFL